MTFELDLHLANGTFHVGAYLYRYDVQRELDRVLPAATFFVASEVDVRGHANLYPKVVSTNLLGDLDARSPAQRRRLRGRGPRRLAADGGDVPDLPQHHGRRRAPHARPGAASSFLSSARRSQRAPRSSTGRSRTSGTSATPISPTGGAAASSTSARTTCTSSTTPCRCAAR